MESLYFRVKVVALLWVALMLFVGLISHSQTPTESEDRHSRHIIMVVICCLLPTIQFLFTYDVVAWARYDFGFPTLNYFGLGLVVAALVLHLGSMHTLSRQWSPNVRFNEEHPLIRAGVYRYIRHPIYAALILEALGFSLTPGNWLAFVLILAPNLAVFAYRIRVEERALIAHFGDAYRQYMRDTRRLIPGVF